MALGWSLTHAQFTALSTLVHRTSGINLHDGKYDLVRSRLAGRLRELDLHDPDVYLASLREPGGKAEIAHLVDALTTNKTSFFREPLHFELLRERVLPELYRRGHRFSVWSAGCSSGEEPYSFALVLLHALGPGAPARILATDISQRMLARARHCLYDAAAIEPVPVELRQRYFSCVDAVPPRTYTVHASARQLVRFARLNLVAPWPMRSRFSLICCRNVMIYFDKPTQQSLVQRLHDQLMPGGYLFTGHSESLAGLEHEFRYIQPAVYQRVVA